jgi:hypothetical protein
MTRHRATAILLTLIVALPAAQAQKRAKKKGPVEESGTGVCDSTAWKLVFHDEFLADELDPTKWVTYFTYSDDGSDRCPSCRVMGGTNNVFTADQVRVKDGTLELGVEGRPTTWYEHNKEHVAGMVHSIGGAQFTYGRFEIRCRVPGAQGLWPAFWGFGGETEIDVFELCGEKPRWMKGSLHRWGEQKHSNTGKVRAPDLSRDFHTYAVEWEPDELRWYLNGEEVYRWGRFMDRRGRPLPGCGRPPGTHATAPFFPRGTDAVNLIINLAVSEPKGFCKGPTRPLQWPTGTALVVDHVRVYQRHPQAGLHDLCAQPRKLVTDSPHPLLPGRERRIRMEGAHGPLQWELSEGLEFVRGDGTSTTVRAQAPGTYMITARDLDDPCGRKEPVTVFHLEVAR